MISSPLKSTGETPVEEQMSGPNNEKIRSRLSWLTYIAVNVWLFYHLFAITICPASVDPAPPVVRDTWRLASGYLQALYLNHGFHFFAPDPAGSALVRYSAVMPDGTIREDQFPNRKIWPRLLYHRHFMLTEFLGNGPEEFSPLVQRAIARNVCRSIGAERVTVYLVTHDTASVQDILAGKTLNEPGSFTEVELGSFSAKELDEAYVPPIVAPMAPEPKEADKAHTESHHPESIAETSTLNEQVAPAPGEAAPAPTE